MQLLYFESKNNTLLSDYLLEELKKDERIVVENDTFVALVPFWAVWPFETMILPKRTVARIIDLTEKEKMDYVDIYKVLTIKYDNLFKMLFSYSVGIHQAPTDGEEHPEWRTYVHF